MLPTEAALVRRQTARYPCAAQLEVVPFEALKKHCAEALSRGVVVVSKAATNTNKHITKAPL